MWKNPPLKLRNCRMLLPFIFLGGALFSSLSLSLPAFSEEVLEADGILIRLARSPMEMQPTRGAQALSATQLSSVRSENTDKLEQLENEKENTDEVSYVDLTAGVAVVQPAENESLEDAAARFEAMGYTATVNYWVKADSFAQLHAFNYAFQSSAVQPGGVDFDGAQTLSAYNTSVLVAVIDSGVDYTHPDLQAAMWTNPGEIAGNGIDDDGNGYVDDVKGWNFFSNTNDPKDNNGHGTHVAGIIRTAGNAAWTSPAKIMPLKFLDQWGNGTIADAIIAIEYAAAKGAKILNNSWGGAGYSQALYDALANVYSQNRLLVMAAGNSAVNNDASPSYPAAFDLPHMLTVVATKNAANGNWLYTNYGATTTHIGAPGEDIYSTYLNGTFATMSGTSMAAPFVSAAAALIFSANPSLSSVQVKNILLSTVTPLASLSSRTSSGGRLNANAAVAMALGVAPAGLPAFSRNVASSSGGGCGSIESVSGFRQGPGAGALSGILLFSVMAFVFLMWRARIARETRRTLEAPRQVHPRFAYESFIRVQVPGAPTMVFKTTNISQGGLAAVTPPTPVPRELKPGQKLQVQLQDAQGDLILAEAEVIWQEESAGRLGFRFTEMSKAAMGAISELVGNLSSAKRTG